jgi:hypothetical protein
MKNIGGLVASVALCNVCLFAAVTAHAQIVLRFSPQDTTIGVGEAGRLSIMLDEVQDVRTIEVSVEYDPEVLVSAGGEPGQGFVDTGCPLFDGFDDSMPGLWQAYVVILGAECWLTGPAELISWDFTSAAPGTSAITAVNISLYAPQSGEVEGVTLSEASVVVTDNTSSAHDRQLWNTRMQAHPNPFNPQTSVSFTLERAEWVEIGVYDLTGRQVTVLADRAFTAGAHSISWDGRDMQGGGVPAGTYVCRLITKWGTESLKVSLVK